MTIDYKKDLENIIFDITSFIFGFNNLNPPPHPFFDWTLQEFLKNLDTLANEVLDCAMISENEAVVKRLIMRDDVDPDSIYHGQTPLIWAAERGHDAVVKQLLEKKADIETKTT